MSEEADEWRWADAEGAVSSVDTWELTSSLATGSLPPYTLVWRQGWAEWLPACQVAELAAAVPSGQAETPVEPALGELKEPPPPPVDKYRAYKPRKPKARTATPPPLPRGKHRRAARSAPRGTSPSVPVRPAMPTLVELQPPSTITLRPPGAVPPPPHAVPSRNTAEQPEKLQPMLPTPVPPVALRDSDSETETERDVDLPGDSKAQGLRAKWGAKFATTLSSAGGTRAPRTGGEGRVPSVMGPRMTLVVIALASVAVALSIAVVILTKWRLNPEVVASARPAATAASGQCLLSHPAERLAPSILISIPPFLEAVPHSARLAVGLAASNQRALGITIDPQTLSARRVFSKRVTKPLTGVVPMTHGGKLEFVADDAAGPLRDARSLDVQPPVVLGMTNGSFARVVGQGAPEIIWPDAASGRVTDVRVATTPKGDHAVAFRRGGQSGQVLVGWLGPHGKKKSVLRAVVPEGHYVGTPVVAANDRAILVAFAARSEKDAYWGVQLAQSAFGRLPRRSQAFAIPPGGPGIETMSPAITGMPGGRWLLQWTEGSRGEHVVRVQMLGADLNPIGDAVTVSAKDANAGQGVIWVHAKNALSLYLVSTGAGHQLWGAALKCQ